MSARPGRVKDVFEVPFERPRSLSLKRDPRFLALEDSVWKLIEEESDKLGMVAAS
jgi:NitT/TauT family transport system ATP-binding protein